MEQETSIFQTANLQEGSIEHLNTTSRWARFIGFVYLVLGILILITTIFLAANMDEIAQTLMQMNGMNETVIDFLQKGGKWLVTLAMTVMSAVIFVNAYFLIRFRSSFAAFLAAREETSLGNAFEQMSKYLMLTTILSVFSALSSLGMILFQLLK